MDTLFDLRTETEIIERTRRLSAGSQPLWGTMNAGQMLCHCADLFRDILGKRETAIVSPPEMTPRIKAFILRPEPFGKNLPAVAPYLQENGGGGTPPTSFENDKNLLIDFIKEFCTTDENFSFSPHAAAGYFNREETGFFMWKHLDHHLRQFGV